MIVISTMGSMHTKPTVAGATLDMNFVTGTYAGASPANLTVSRALAAYHETAAGVLTSFSSNVARITDLGLLVEPASTNIQPKSNALSDAAWNYTGLTAVQNVVSPTGATDAWTLTENTATTGHRFFYNTGVTVTSGQTVTASCYLKAGTRRYVAFSVSNGSNVILVTVDTVKWTCLTYKSGSGVLVGADLRKVGTSGWYRISLTGSLTGVTGYFIDIDGSSSYTPAQVGISYTGTSSTLIVYGLQIEAGTEATSYIPTTTAAVTRPADVITMTGTDFSNWYSSIRPGTLYFEGTVTGKYASAWYPFSMSDGTANNVIGISTTSGNFTLKLAGSSGGVAQNSVTGLNDNWPKSIVKLAAAFQTNDISMSDKGYYVATNSTFTMPASLNQASFGSSGTSLIRRITYTPSRLADATLRATTDTGQFLIYDSTNYTAGQYLVYLSPWGSGGLTEGVDFLNRAKVSSGNIGTLEINSWWPSNLAQTVFGYMFVSYGAYDGGTPAVAVTSKQVSAIGSFTTTWDWDATVSYGEYDGLMEFYTTTTPSGSGTKTAEMGFFFHTNASTVAYAVAGTSLGTVTISGILWKVYRVVGGVANNYVMFIPNNEADIPTLTLDLKAALTFAIAQGVVSSSDYVNGAAFGLEPNQGNCYLKINSWSASLS